ncbi:hypothetical protein [Pseudonocardia xishanensis]|uniref:Nucleotidyltransferase-like protein n=1 Tax=Pseudonocardia xishanensis TaxID=630995 RepID=A0ABP8RCF7_9PSEU
MTVFASVPAVGTGQDLTGDIAAWTGSEPLRRLVAAFGGSDVLFGDDRFGDEVARRLERLDAFSDRWDTRRGAERNLAATLDLTPDQENLVLAAARALGLVHPVPPSRARYDHIFVLGGLVRACLVRPAYAAELIRSGTVWAPVVTALGGHRPFGGDEPELARRAGIPAIEEEYEALDAGTRHAFGLGNPIAQEGATSDLPGGTWSVRTYEDPSGLRVNVAAAPSSVPAERRANTADTYAWFASHLARLEKGQSLLAVTTAIYVPAQQAAALRMLALPFGVAVETVGVIPGDVLPALAQPFGPSQYLQEIRSAIRGYRNLLAAQLRN